MKLIPKITILILAISLGLHLIDKELWFGWIVIGVTACVLGVMDVGKHKE